MGVHPRVGGETHRQLREEMREDGPSPRGRGNLLCRRPIGGVLRSIPAWAGKPYLSGLALSRFRVHPRVGGETIPGAVPAGDIQGPSPRGRGNHSSPDGLVDHVRSIPAWAGKPGSARSSTIGLTVHPRVGGETSSCGRRCRMRRGPSPRGRGNLPEPTPRMSIKGSIPAWAGKPRRAPVMIQAFWVHPRVGGETRVRRASGCCHSGPSPRGRGNRLQPRSRCRPVGSIPAWAGKPLRGPPVRQPSEVHPRVGGETPWAFSFSRCCCGPSPRGRGNRHAPDHGPGHHRSIPAWAGKPSWAVRWSVVNRVHPRVGGETQITIAGDFSGDGPSPRGRGNRLERSG